MLRLSAVGRLAVAQLIAWGVLHYAFSALLARGRPVATGLSIALVASAVTTAFLAPVSSWIGTRRTMIAGAVLGVGSLSGLAVAPWSYSLWAVLGAAQTATLYEVAFIAIAAWHPNSCDARRALVIVTVLGGLASTIFVPLVNGIAGLLSWRDTLFVLAAAFALTVLPIYAALPDARPRPRRPHSHAVRPLGSLAFAFALQAFVATGAVVHLVSELAGHDRSLARASTLAALMGISQVAGRVLLSSPRATSVDARVTVALVAQAAALALIGSTSDVAAAAAVMGFGATNGILTVDRNLALLERYGPDGFASAAGRLATVSAFAKAAAPAIVAAIMAFCGGRRTFFVLAGCLVVSGIIFFASIRTPLRLWRCGRHGC